MHWRSENCGMCEKHVNLRYSCCTRKERTTDWDILTLFKVIIKIDVSAEAISFSYACPWGSYSVSFLFEVTYKCQWCYKSCRAITITPFSSSFDTDSLGELTFSLFVSLQTELKWLGRVKPMQAAGICGRQQWTHCDPWALCASRFCRLEFRCVSASPLQRSQRE